MTAYGSAVRRRWAAVAACAALLTTTACSAGRETGTDPTTRLEVVSWWTSGSEKAALDVLFSEYAAAHPGVTVDNAAVAGGGGSNVQGVLASRLREGDPPDVWQTFDGTSLRE